MNDTSSQVVTPRKSYPFQPSTDYHPAASQVNLLLTAHRRLFSRFANHLPVRRRDETRFFNQRRKLISWITEREYNRLMTPSKGGISK